MHHNEEPWPLPYVRKPNRIQKLLDASARENPITIVGSADIFYLASKTGLQSIRSIAPPIHWVASLGPSTSRSPTQSLEKILTSDLPSASAVPISSPTHRNALSSEPHVRSIPS